MVSFLKKNQIYFTRFIIAQQLMGRKVAIDDKNVKC